MFIYFLWRLSRNIKIFTQPNHYFYVCESALSIMEIGAGHLALVDRGVQLHLVPGELGRICWDLRMWSQGVSQRPRAGSKNSRSYLNLWHSHMLTRTRVPSFVGSLQEESYRAHFFPHQNKKSWVQKIASHASIFFSLEQVTRAVALLPSPLDPFQKVKWAVLSVCTEQKGC